MLANNGSGSASDSDDCGDCSCGCTIEPPYESCVGVAFALHASVALNGLESLCVELLLFTNCSSALFTGRLSKSVIIAAYDGWMMK